MLSAVVGGLIMSLLLPALLGVNPVAMLRGEYLGGRAATPGQVRIISTDTTAAPTVAVAARLDRSVVNISTQQLRFDPFSGGDQRVTGTGSGVILTEDGYILTNNHVVSGAEKIFVTIGSDANIVGTVVGRDADSDLAVIKVERSGLTPAEFGDSDQLKVGEPVVAVGSPFGLQHSVTYGIVSALARNQQNRTERGVVTYTDLIQTDAAINPGNSGGALANMAGQVVGINALIEAPSAGVGAAQSAGIGFAIPSNFARKVADQLRTKQAVRHTYLGIVSGNVTPELAQQHKLAVEKGAYIVELPEGPAKKAGVKVGDVLVEISGFPITSVEDIFAALRRHDVGDVVTLTVYRGSEKKTIKVTLAEKPKELLPPG
jgi:putative serine protease PepD